MKKFYIDGKQVTEAEAAEASKKNNEYINSGDFSNLIKCKFIVELEEDENGI